MALNDYSIRKMQISDLEQVLSIEQVCFPTPWSKQAFLYEILDNDLADYIVIDQGGQIKGYAGMWIILDEAHVTTIAVSPSCRREKLGETMLRELECLGACQGAKKITLEVRTSNFAAQALYHKLGYDLRGIRKGYYSDTKEDAMIMWKDKLDN